MNKRKKAGIIEEFYLFNKENSDEVKEVYNEIKKEYIGKNITSEYIKFEKIRIKKELGNYESSSSKKLKGFIVGLAVAITPIYLQGIVDLIPFFEHNNKLKSFITIVLYLGVLGWFAYKISLDNDKDNTKSIMLHIALEVLEEVELEVIENETERNELKYRNKNNKTKNSKAKKKIFSFIKKYI